MKVVESALGTEEKPIIENIISLFQQLLSMQEAEASQTNPEVVEEAQEEMEEIDVAKSVDGEDGETPAEKRNEEGTPGNDASLQDLKKAITTFTNAANAMSKNQATKSVKPVAKSSQTQVLLTELSKVLKSISSKQEVQDQFNTQIMDALGFSKDVIKKALPEEDKPKDKPVQSIDTTAVIKDVLAGVLKAVPAFNQNPDYQNSFNTKRDARKDLNVIADFVGKRRD